MPHLQYPRQFRLPTQESPNLPVLSTLPFRSATSTPAGPVATSRPRQTSRSSSTLTTRTPQPAMTTLITTNANGLPLTIVGSIVPTTGIDSRGSPVRSAIANGRTTIPLAATADSIASPAPSTLDVASPSPTGRVSDTTSGLSSGDIAAAVVVPVIVVVAGALLALFLSRRRRRRGAQSAAAVSNAPNANASDGSAAVPTAMTERKKRTIPFLPSKYQRDSDTRVTSSGPNPASVTGPNPASMAIARGQVASSAGLSTMSNPFTDGSNRSDAFAGFSGAGTDTDYSSLSTTKGTTTPNRPASPARERAFSPIPESERAVSRLADDGDADDDDAAISEMSDETEYQDTHVQVAQAHMGRAHRASVITMRGMGGDASSPDSASPKSSSSPAR